MTNNSQSDANFCVAVPGNDADEGLRFLESMASGNIGAGLKMTAQGHTIPQIRSQYKVMIDKFEADLNMKKQAGLYSKELARWAVNERTRIARWMRAQQGGGAQVILELRDNLKYGLGGRSYDNLAKRAGTQGVPETQIADHLLKNSTKPNKAINETAIKSAKFLKNGGRAVVFVSISATAYILLTAPEGQLEQILYEEVGAVAGGFVGGGAGVGLCLVFGIATSGWGAFSLWRCWW